MRTRLFVLSIVLLILLVFLAPSPILGKQGARAEAIVSTSTGADGFGQALNLTSESALTLIKQSRFTPVTEPPVQAYAAAEGVGNWVRVSTTITETLAAVTFVDTQTGWAAGKSGAIFSTKDGGQTWQRQQSRTTDDLRDIAFLDVNRGWAVGGQGLILRTSDGGATWTTQASPCGRFLDSIDFADEDHGWIAGGSYTLSGPPWVFRANGCVVRTTDGGDSWSNAASPYYEYATDIHFVDTLQGWLITEYVNNSTYKTIPGIYATSDGGNTWARQPIPVSSGALHAVTFVDADTGWAVGESGVILHTANRGVLWNKQTSGASSVLNAVQFTSPTTGWAVGSFLHTTDGGESWSSQSADPACTGLNDLHMADDDHGWVVGQAGVICKYELPTPTPTATPVPLKRLYMPLIVAGD